MSKRRFHLENQAEKAVALYLSASNNDLYDHTAIARSMAARAALIDAGKYLRQDFQFAAYWKTLAIQRGIKLPERYCPCIPEHMHRWLRNLGITADQYRAWHDGSPEEFAHWNPDWPLWAWVGLLLEDIVANSTGGLTNAC